MDNISVTGKKVKTLKIFENNGEDFSAFREAEKFARENGFSVGSMEREAPIGLAKGECYISKWRNMSRQDHKELDGTISFPDGSPRNGRAVVELYE